jgi:hypothetical protein
MRNLRHRLQQGHLSAKRRGPGPGALDTASSLRQPWLQRWRRRQRKLKNCTVTGNSAVSAAAVWQGPVFLRSRGHRVNNCIVYSNSAPAGDQLERALEALPCLHQLVHNACSDRRDRQHHQTRQLFVDPAADNFRLPGAVTLHQRRAEFLRIRRRWTSRGNPRIAGGTVDNGRVRIPITAVNDLLRMASAVWPRTEWLSGRCRILDSDGLNTTPGMARWNRSKPIQLSVLRLLPPNRDSLWPPVRWQSVALIAGISLNAAALRGAGSIRAAGH